ncbi:hypothetical protein ANTQUA_LOCUS8442 [Anthophora quadrimaculata]
MLDLMSLETRPLCGRGRQFASHVGRGSNTTSTKMDILPLFVPLLTTIGEYFLHATQSRAFVLILCSSTLTRF